MDKDKCEKLLYFLTGRIWSQFDKSRPELLRLLDLPEKYSEYSYESVMEKWGEEDSRKGARLYTLLNALGVLRMRHDLLGDRGDQLAKMYGFHGKKEAGEWLDEAEREVFRRFYPLFLYPNEAKAAEHGLERGPDG